MDLIELLEKIAGRPVTPTEVEAVREAAGGVAGMAAGIDRDTDRLRAAADRLREDDGA